jgi:hypothetical protein
VSRNREKVSRAGFRAGNPGPESKLFEEGGAIAGCGAVHATELIHIPMFVISSEGTINEFIDAAFNFPILAEGFTHASYDGLRRLARRESAAAPPPYPEGRLQPPATRPS